MEFRPRTTENDGDSLPTTVDATQEPTRGVTSMYRAERGRTGQSCLPPGCRGCALLGHGALSRQHSRTVWEPRTDHEDLLSQTTFFFFLFFGNFYYSIKVLLSLQNLLT